MTFESTQLTPFCLEKSSVRKWTILCFSSVFSANWAGIGLSASWSNCILGTRQMLMHEKTCVIPISMHKGQDQVNIVEVKYNRL